MPTLFTTYPLSELTEGVARLAVEEVARVPEERIISDAPGVAADVISKHAIADVELQSPSGYTADPAERYVTVVLHGEHVRRPYWYSVLEVPYTGGVLRLFQSKASSFVLAGQPAGEVGAAAVLLEVRSDQRTAEELNANAQTALVALRKHVEWANADLAVARAALEQRVRAAVDTRSKSIKARRAASAELDFPVKSANQDRGLRPWS